MIHAFVIDEQINDKTEIFLKALKKISKGSNSKSLIKKFIKNFSDTKFSIEASFSKQKLLDADNTAIIINFNKEYQEKINTCFFVNKYGSYIDVDNIDKNDGLKDFLADKNEVNLVLELVVIR